MEVSYFFSNCEWNSGTLGELIYTCKMVQPGIFPGSVNLYIFPGCNLKILQCLAGYYQVWTWKKVQVDWTWKVGSFYRYRLILQVCTSMGHLFFPHNNWVSNINCELWDAKADDCCILQDYEKNWVTKQLPFPKTIKLQYFSSVLNIKITKIIQMSFYSPLLILLRNLWGPPFIFFHRCNI